MNMRYICAFHGLPLDHRLIVTIGDQLCEVHPRVRLAQAIVRDLVAMKGNKKIVSLDVLVSSVMEFCVRNLQR